MVYVQELILLHARRSTNQLSYLVHYMGPNYGLTFHVLMRKKLETMHHFIAKYIQSLPKRTRTDIAIGMLGMGTLESIIHKRKLSFLYSLMNCPPNNTTKQLFVHRFMMYRYIENRAMDGFLPDIMNIVYKYGLQDVLNNFTDGSYSTKIMWRKSVNNSIMQIQEASWACRMHHDNDFSRFKEIHDNLRTADVWIFLRRFPNLQEQCFSMARELSLLPDCELSCVKCNLYCHDAVQHTLLRCKNDVIVSRRDKFRTNVINDFNIHLYPYLDSVDEQELLHIISGKNSNNIQRFLVNEQFTSKFKILCLDLVNDICKLTFQ